MSVVIPLFTDKKKVTKRNVSIALAAVCDLNILILPVLLTGEIYLQ